MSFHKKETEKIELVARPDVGLQRHNLVVVLADLGDHFVPDQVLAGRVVHADGVQFIFAVRKFLRQLFQEWCAHSFSYTFANNSQHWVIETQNKLRIATYLTWYKKE